MLKRGKEIVRNSVCLSINVDVILALERCGKFLKRSRTHIVNHENLDNGMNVPAENKLCSLIKNIVVG